MKKVVESYNEWDPLEEVVVGSLDEAMLPTWQTILEATVPLGSEYLAAPQGGKTQYPAEQIAAGKKDLDEFIRLLEAEGITVRQAEPHRFSAPFSTPDWSVENGFCAANPRDVFLVIGDEIIEVPMAHRDRHYEMHAYRGLLKDYFLRGARWTSAPKPQLLDDLYEDDYAPPTEGEEVRYVTTEFEPVFDAADFIRCGRDLFVQRSHVTNEMGIEWLRRHLGSEYRIHRIETKCKQPYHIDTTFMPMAAGRLVYNPQFLDFEQIPEFVRKQWEVFECPPPVTQSWQKDMPLSEYINMNFLMIDEERVFVEKAQTETIAAFKKWGFKPIPCPFFNYYIFGGSFHCATLDVRRRGSLQSYFDVK